MAKSAIMSNKWRPSVNWQEAKGVISSNRVLIKPIRSIDKSDLIMLTRRHDSQLMQG